jgi:hypothetical protein
MHQHVFPAPAEARVRNAATPSSRNIKTIAMTTLKTVWKSAVIPAAFGSSRSKRSAKGCRDGNARATLISRLSKFPSGTRRPAMLPDVLPSKSGLIALPRLAPRTSAKAATGVTKCE